VKLAVIPARVGSKRIPRKNIRDFFGKPMIAWSIEAALASQCFDRIVVSTDDPEIASIANFHGAETPFVRPAELSSDFATTGAVMRHALDWMRQSGLSTLDYACCIYATAPSIRPSDLRLGLSELLLSAADYAFAVTDFDCPIQRALRVDSTGRLSMVQPEHYLSRSQDLEPMLHDAGQFYWGTNEAWLMERPILSPAAVPVRLPRYLVQDIDTEEDWIRAELIFRHLRELDQ
jgi:N-acylneuraminate cytidylyltransferase